MGMRFDKFFFLQVKCGSLGDQWVEKMRNRGMKQMRGLRAIPSGEPRRGQRKVER